MIQAVIRPLASEDWNIATALVWRVFLRHNAPDYDQEGIGSFLNFISDEHLRLFCQLDEFRMYGAYLGAFVEFHIGYSCKNNRFHNDYLLCIFYAFIIPQEKNICQGKKFTFVT